MIQGKKYINDDVVYTSFKKHYCPDCSNKLKTVKVSKVVNYKSPEAKDYDFYFGRPGQGVMVTGDAMFIWKEFECSNCARHFTVEELKKIEGVEQNQCDSTEKTSIIGERIKHLIIFLATSIVFAAIIYLLKRFVL